VLSYLARYVFRVAITNNRIVGLDENGVTFRHKHRESNRWRTIRLGGHEFMRRSCSTCFPRACTRSATTASGNPTRREHARRARLLLLLGRRRPSGLEDTIHRDGPPMLSIGLATTPHALNRASVRAVRKAISFTSAVSIPNRRADHDYQYRPSRSRLVFSAHVRGMQAADTCLAVIMHRA